MKFSGLNRPLAGVLVPVFSLRSKESAGTGEFLDLVPFGDWCKKSGLEVIQLLPVNDTGDDPSPYSALSAFALHPLYTRVQALPELDSVKNKQEIIKKLANLRVSHDGSSRLAYRDVLYGKLEILHDVFRANEAVITADSELKTWIKRNPWVTEYAVFRALKDREQLRSWVEWSDNIQPTTEDIQKLWKSKKLPTLFYAWIQYRLEQQFLAAAQHLQTLGILLKGDIPILMNEDSVDVWAHRDIFYVDQRAGAPPDGFSPEGQNWGFPIYNWDALQAQDYGWWRRRLLQADKFYQAYRIDHVLGFFRIWTIGTEHSTGALGYFNPAAYIHRADFYRKGFDDARIRWLSEPHIRGEHIRGVFGVRSDEVIKLCFSQVGNEDLYVFTSAITGEKAIQELPIAWQEKDTLLGWFRDRTFIQVNDHEFAPAWTFRDCSRFQELGDGEKAAIEELVAQKGGESEHLWAQTGKRLLGFMRETVEMLTCAEDLGAVPDCVPRTLGELSILGLKIPRWSRRWHEPGQPYVPIWDYPFLSVCAPSVHDTSTLRDWWENEDGSEAFWYSLGCHEGYPRDFNPSIAQKVLKKLMEAGSALCVFQLQDYFALYNPYRVDDPQDERINIPGTVQETNWSYRIPMTIEDLQKEDGFTAAVRDVTSVRAQS
ncbi:4-alpha-glucanotransferase [Spirochaeta lutea]|uniref:4-alpha-glucanotransferase n=1 Tax=Spirochaeta lutea TaxID=1480694 RepID=A0A098QWL0_9SPIO|nr:4-alpha-glucanotransferase [Spirochaeta lutea]KGE71946.1 4-alpha-glucanotransferase [Spirochaeta lutea]